MKKILTFLLFCTATAVSAQNLYKPSALEISTLPQWAQEMYAAQPNVFHIDSLYSSYYRTHDFEKNYHTQYYKRWRKSVIPFVTATGEVQKPAPDASKLHSTRPRSNSRASWQALGPFRTYDDQNTMITDQTNVYSIDQCAASPNVMFCGTETAEIYKSSDGGQTWFCVSEDVVLYNGVTAVEVDPTNAQNVFAGSGDYLLRSTDGGVTWNAVITSSNLNANEILVNPANPNLVLVAADKGLYRSTDGGQNFTQLFTDDCYDVKLRPGSPGVVYLLKNNPTLIRSEFFISSDTGLTFTIQTSGWYSSTDPARNDGGSRIGVTPADPQRVYAYLIGESKPNDVGFIGLYKSTDGGQTWTLPNGPDGGPYSTSHPNLAQGTPTWNYHQGFYNCAIMVSNTNADSILIGGLNTWRSNDGGSTFSSVSGYVGGPLGMHVDMQDFRATPGGYWLTCDGGIYFSNDFYTATYAAKMDGVRGSDYWGFGQGWNDDITTGGLYHNGNTASNETYPAGTNLQLGGGEPASGYINPGGGRRAYSSDIGGAVIPAAIGQPINRFSVGMFPNESYWAAESSEMEFLPDCYNHIYLGKDNNLWKSTDGGAAFNLVNAFGTNANARVHHIEISRSNTNVMYVSQRPATGNTGYLFKSTDGGATWSPITIPASSGGNRSRILLALSPVNSNLLFLAYPGGSNGNKVFKTTDGGVTWTNLTTTDLNGEEVRSLVHIGGTNDGLYAFTFNSVYYRNASSGVWNEVNTGLPTLLNSDLAKPFYRDGKIRVATYGKGIWESALEEQPAAPIAKAMVDKLAYELYCEVDTFYYDDYSILNHTGASWSWSFPGGSPSSSTLRNPKVVYNTPGTYQAYLTVTDAANQSGSDTISVVVSAYQLATQLQQGFQGSFYPAGWFPETNPGSGQWSLSTAAGGYGNSTQSAIFDNYNFDAQGAWAEMRIGTNLNNVSGTLLTFDVAYSLYGFPYSDTLQVRVSTDCGATWTTHYTKGGSQLATAPNNTSSTFVPTASQWRTDTVNLAQYLGQPNVMIAFRNIGRFGQAMYVDNINLNATNTIADPVTVTAINVFPNPAVAGQPLYLQADAAQQYLVELFDAQGKNVMQQRMNGNTALLLPAELAEGVYTVRITGEKQLSRKTLVISKR